MSTISISHLTCLKKDVILGKPTNTGIREFDFVSLKEEYNDLSEEETNIAVETYKEFIDSNYNNLCLFWKEGRKEDIIELVKDFKADKLVNGLEENE